MTPDPMSATRRAAAAVLGVEPEAPRDEVRSAFLRRLAAGLVPEPRVRAAAGEFGLIPPGPASRAALDTDTCRDLGSAIEEFAGSYWDLGPTERRGRWSELLKLAERHPRLVARLEDLAAGLDMVPPADIEDLVESRLAEAVVELYPLRPAGRARRRAQLLPEVGPTAAVRRAAQGLRRTCPALEQIDHGLLESQSFVRPPVEPVRTARRRRPEPEVEEPQPAGASFPRWGWVLIPLCLSVCSGLARMGRTTNDAVPAPRPTYLTPATDRDRFAQSIAMRPETYEEMGRNLSQTRTIKVGLTTPQRAILVGLIGRTDLTELDATVLADQFLAPPPARPPGIFMDPAMNQPPDPRLTAEQRAIWDRLAHTSGLSENLVRDLLVAFVKVGRRRAGGAARP